MEDTIACSIWGTKAEKSHRHEDIFDLVLGQVKHTPREEQNCMVSEHLFDGLCFYSHLRPDVTWDRGS